MPFFLVTDVNEPVIYAHFEFGGRDVAFSLVFVEFFETLEGCFYKEIEPEESVTRSERNVWNGDALFMSCCSSSAMEKSFLSCIMCKARIWNRAQRSWHSIAMGPVSCCIVKSFLTARERSRRKV